MLFIPTITSAPKQQMTIPLPDGSSFFMALEYKEQQLGWFITTLTYKTFTVNNIRIVNSPNILSQYKNLITFGLACFVEKDQEPTLVEDFETERAALWVMDSVDLASYEALLSGQV